MVPVFVEQGQSIHHRAMQLVVALKREQIQQCGHDASIVSASVPSLTAGKIPSFTVPSGCPVAALAILYSSLVLPATFLTYFNNSLSTFFSARTPTRCAI